MVPAYVNEDIQFVEATLGKFYLQCQSELTTRLLARYQAQLQQVQHQTRIDGELIKVNDVLNETRSKLEATQREADACLEFKMHMANTWANDRKKKRERHTMRYAMYAWRRGKDLSKDQKRRDHIVLGHMHRYRTHKSFLAWRRMASQTRRTMNERFFANQLKATTGKIIASYEANLANLRAQVAEYELKFRHQKQDADLMEEKLKQALVRGVCALNRATLNVFNDRAPIDTAAARTSSGILGTVPSLSDPYTIGTDPYATEAPTVSGSVWTKAVNSCVQAAGIQSQLNIFLMSIHITYLCFLLQLPTHARAHTLTKARLLRQCLLNKTTPPRLRASLNPNGMSAV
jgi:hypothetical protein